MKQLLTTLLLLSVINAYALDTSVDLGEERSINTPTPLTPENPDEDFSIKTPGQTPAQVDFFSEEQEVLPPPGTETPAVMVAPTPMETPVEIPTEVETKLPNYQATLGEYDFTIYLNGPWNPPSQDVFLPVMVAFFNSEKSNIVPAESSELNRFQSQPHIHVINAQKHNLYILPNSGEVLSVSDQGTTVSTRDHTLWQFLTANTKE